MTGSHEWECLGCHDLRESPDGKCDCGMGSAVKIRVNAPLSRWMESTDE